MYKVTKTSIIARTLKNRVDYTLTDEELDVLEALHFKGNKALVEELGIELKDPSIVSRVQSLYNKGLVSLQDLVLWQCPSCQKGNVAPSSDPRKVVCSNCGAHYTVTGRHIDGKLIVQRFNMR